MVLLQGIQLPDNKPLRYALLQFYGISHDRAARVLAALSIHDSCLVGALSEDQVNRLGAHLTTLTIESDLRRQMRADIARLRNIGTYRGRRHAMGLPVRGQNTQNNSMNARKLNRVDRRNYTTSAIAQSEVAGGEMSMIEAGHIGRIQPVTQNLALRTIGTAGTMARLGRVFGRLRLPL